MSTNISTFSQDPIQQGSQPQKPNDRLRYPSFPAVLLPPPIGIRSVARTPKANRIVAADRKHPR